LVQLVEVTRTKLTQLRHVGNALLSILSVGTALAQAPRPTECRPLALIVVPMDYIEARKPVPGGLKVQACPDGIHFIAPGEQSLKAPLHITTSGDEFIEQMVAIGRSVAVVTGGGTTSRLWVFEFLKDGPALSYKATTKEAVSIKTEEPTGLIVDLCPVHEPCRQLRFGAEKPKLK
jgi:hypothetical protein